VTHKWLPLNPATTKCFATNDLARFAGFIWFARFPHFISFATPNVVLASSFGSVSILRAICFIELFSLIVELFSLVVESFSGIGLVGLVLISFV
jgi:hypothetical protein